MPKILIIDEVQDNQKYFSEILKEFIPGCIILTAKSGQKGITTAKKESPDLTLLKINKFNNREYNICKSLKSNNGTAYCPVIMVYPENNNLESRIKGIENGADAFLYEPVNKDDLIIHIQIMLRMREKFDTLLKDRDSLAITVQKSITESKGNEDRYRRIIKAITSYIYTVYFENGLPVETMHGHACVAVTGYTAEKYMVNPYLWIQMVHEDDRKAVEEQAANVLSGKNVDPLDHRIIRKDGELRWVRNTIVPRYNTEGLLLSYDGLIQDITERKIAEEQIKNSLMEKEILLKEIHHRVKNNMQVISSLLNLQAVHIKDERDQELFNDSQNRIHSMALVHEKLYQSQDLASVNFEEYINTLTAKLIRFYNVRVRVKVKIKVKGVYLGVDTAIPCALIINELVSNSLKYAFKHGSDGEIKIEFFKDKNDKNILIISDNGIGLPKNLDINNTKTLGLELVSALTKQLKGNVELQRKNGTKFTVIF